MEMGDAGGEERDETSWRLVEMLYRKKTRMRRGSGIILIWRPSYHLPRLNSSTSAHPSLLIGPCPLDARHPSHDRRITAFAFPPSAADHSLSSQSRTLSSQNMDKKRWQSHSPRDAVLVNYAGRVLYVHFTSSAVASCNMSVLSWAVDGLPALRITPCLIFCDRLRSSRTQQAYLQHTLRLHSSPTAPAALSRWRKLSAFHHRSPSLRQSMSPVGLHHLSVHLGTLSHSRSASDIAADFISGALHVSDARDSFPARPTRSNRRHPFATSDLVSYSCSRSLVRVAVTRTSLHLSSQRATR
ncbi:hypothetical protein C8Q73DRAFT_533866 [Cubamyces lactineus]|nr:hypothetical protein C8Q73DRAFT_533866 [Cubamyces lactineus]